MRALRRSAVPLLGVVLSAGLLFDTRGLDEVVSGQQLGPGFWPRVVLIGLAAACLARLASGVRRGRAAVRAGEVSHEPRADNAPPMSPVRLGAAIITILLYVLAVPVLGFPLTTAGFIIAFMSLCGTRSSLALAANGLLGTVGLLYLFVKVVYLPLPKGDGPFEAVTLALYRLLRIF